METVSVHTTRFVEDALFIPGVDAYPTRGVNDAFFVKQQPHMNHVTSLVLKKGQVAGSSLIQRWNTNPL